MDWKDWNKEKPSKVGDIIWLLMADCGCCVEVGGFAYVLEKRSERLNCYFHYQINNQCFVIDWEGNKPPTHDGKEPIISHWSYINLPE